MMMPKQKPVNPAPPMAPSCAPVNPKSRAQLARMPPRMPKPMPAARIARNPAHNRRMAFGAIPWLLTLAVPLLMVILIATVREFGDVTLQTAGAPLRCGPPAWRPFARAAGPPRDVLDQEQPALAGAHHVEIAVAIDVDDRDLHPAAHAAAVVDKMADPLHLRRLRPCSARRGGLEHPELVPVDPERLVLARIGAVVRHEPLAGDQIESSVPVEIDQRRGMSLRPRTVDDPLGPLLVRSLLEPEHPEVVP